MKSTSVMDNTSLKKEFYDSQKGNEKLDVEGRTYTGRMVIPNSAELSSQHNIGSGQHFQVPFITKVRKFFPAQMKLMTPTSAVKEREEYRKFCKKYTNRIALYHLQVVSDTNLNNTQVEFVEEVQRISETPFFLGYDKGYMEPAKEYITRQLAYKHDMPQKIILPVLDLNDNNAKELIQKSQNIVKEGFKACVVIYRGDTTGWHAVMPLLKDAKIYVFCLGVNPRYSKSKGLEASSLTVPFMYGANSVCHGYSWVIPDDIPPAKFIDESWYYILDKKRQTSDPAKDYEHSRVEAIETTNDSCKSVLGDKSISEIVIAIPGFRHMAEKIGILDKGRMKNKSLLEF